MRIDRLTRRFSGPAAVFLAALFFCGAPASGQDLTAASEPGSPSDVLADPVRARLGGDALIVHRGSDRIRFWWVRSLPVMRSTVTPGWSDVEVGTLVGAMETAAPLPDIRGVPISPGLYTLRFAKQPQDGDHMGVSPYREFLVVAPAGEDRAADAIGFEAAVELGKKTQGRSHPAVLSVDPPSSEAAAGAIISTEERHTAVVVSIPATHEDRPTGALTFGLILVGRIEH